MSMYGADVAQLRTLAQQFDRHAQQLDANRMTVGNAIQISAWFGPFSVRFRHQWDSDYSRRVHDAAERLRHAASDLRRNADEQDRASAVDGGSAVAGGGGQTGKPRGAVGVDVLGVLDSFFHDVVIGGPDGLGKALDFASTFVEGKTGQGFDPWKFLPHGSYVSSAFKGIGLGDAVGRFQEAVRDRDWSGAMVASGDGVATVTPAPVSFLWNSLKDMTGFFIPLDHATQDEHLAWMQSRGYSAEQQVERYSGLQGFINLGNDNVERQAPWLNRVVGDPFYDAGSWLYSHGIKF